VIEGGFKRVTISGEKLVTDSGTDSGTDSSTDFETSFSFFLGRHFRPPEFWSDGALLYELCIADQLHTLHKRRALFDQYARLLLQKKDQIWYQKKIKTGITWKILFKTTV